jgi:hypothetical protein
MVARQPSLEAANHEHQEGIQEGGPRKQGEASSLSELRQERKKASHTVCHPGEEAEHMWNEAMCFSTKVLRGALTDNFIIICKAVTLSRRPSSASERNKIKQSAPATSPSFSL